MCNSHPPLSITDLFVVIMVKVMGKAFVGGRDYFYVDWRLQIAAGSVRCFAEFTPTDLMAEVHFRVDETLFYA